MQKNRNFFSHFNSGHADPEIKEERAPRVDKRKRFRCIEEYFHSSPAHKLNGDLCFFEISHRCSINNRLLNGHYESISDFELLFQYFSSQLSRQYSEFLSYYLLDIFSSLTGILDATDAEIYDALFYDVCAQEVILIIRQTSRHMTTTRSRQHRHLLPKINYIEYCETCFDNARNVDGFFILLDPASYVVHQIEFQYPSDFFSDEVQRDVCKLLLKYSAKMILISIKASEAYIDEFERIARMITPLSNRVASIGCFVVDCIFISPTSKFSFHDEGFIFGNS